MDQKDDFLEASSLIVRTDRRSAWRKTIAAVVGGLLVGGLGTWAGITAFAPPANVEAEQPFTLAQVKEGSVGATLNLTTVATWRPVRVGANLSPGTVTSVVAKSGETVKAGSALYTVNLRPVVVAKGTVPAFRSMSQGTKGADVAQLQSLLTTLGLYKGAPDGTFGWATQRAVRAWQLSLGLDVDGVVQAGDVFFVPQLPTRILLDDSIVVRGNTLSGGEIAILALPDVPQFSVPVSEAQSAAISDGTRVEISGPNGEEWAGFISGREKQSDSDTIDLMLAGKDDTPICQDECEALSVTTPSSLASKVVTVETVEGLVVPTAAILTKSDASVFVVDQKGTEHPVVVLASARGISVIRGVDAGLMVRLPGDAK